MVSHPVGWGIGHALGGLAIAYFTLILGTTLVVLAFGGRRDGELVLDQSMGLTVALQAFLWVGYVGTTLLVSRRMGQGPRRDYGWRFAPRDWYQGLLVGVGLQLLAVPAIYLILFQFIEQRDVSEAARDLVDQAVTPIDVVLLVLIVAIGAPIVEELFFRGLLLRAIQRRFGPTPALISSSVVFGVIHFQLLQLPALLMFGLVAGWVTLRTGRLGPAIWIHVGFNSTTVAILLASA